MTSALPWKWRRCNRTKKMVELYKKHECLWNQKSQDYRDSELRNRAYEAIVREMKIKNFGVKEVKTKIRIIRNTYAQELQKIKKSKEDAEGLYTPTLSWFRCADSFMRDVISTRSQTLNQNKKRNIQPVDGEGYEENAALGGAPQIVVPDENGDTDVENSSNIFTYIPEAQFQTSEQDRTFIPETSFETCEQFIKIENNGRKKSNLKLLDQRQLENSEQRICNAIEELREISASVRSAEKEDEFDLFGRSIAEQLRQLPLEDALSIQLKLQTVVTEARLKATKSKARLENGVSDN
ncbi:hypothetical protein C0J52_11148 [Blattella germanica]|nr:hypothetical protein C0J52_11148 [Blattella germanica]